jgi:catechol 2,3-dioxygenase-like lactoylglutathione lyase family enzyme
MIDHVSIAVRDLAGCGRFYDAALAPLGFRRMIVRPATIGFGKKYPEFWLNERRAMTAVDVESGAHVALRAPDTQAVDAFYAAALHAGAATGIHRRLLRRFRARSRRQPHRGGDLHRKPKLTRA